MASDNKPRLLIVSTTPGPSRALAAAASDLTDVFSIQVLTSSDTRFGRGGEAYRDFGVTVTMVEEILPSYQPLAVTADQAADLLGRLSPDVLLAGAVNEPTGELRPLEDVMCLSASTAGLPNAQFVEGWDVWHPRSWAAPSAANYLVIDAYAGQVLRCGGVPVEKIAIVGYSPTLMVPNSIDPQERARVRSALGIAEERRAVMYFGQVGCDDVETLGWTARALGSRDHLILQRHPRDVRPLEMLLARCSGNSVTVSDIPSTRAIHAADICVTHFSLMSFTAAALGIPTILTLLPGDVGRIRDVCGQYPTTLLRGTAECYDFSGLCRALAVACPPDAGFVGGVRRAAASFSSSIAACLLSASAGARLNSREKERTSLGN